MATYSARATGYHKDDGVGPYNRGLEGGNKDMRGVTLSSMEDYFAGRAKTVSVAMDIKDGMLSVVPYGANISIRFNDATRQKLAAHFNTTVEAIDAIQFVRVDTGGAFYHQGTGRMDICSGYSCRMDDLVSGRITYSVNGKIDPQFLKDNPDVSYVAGADGADGHYNFSLANDLLSFLSPLQLQKKMEEDKDASKVHEEKSEIFPHETTDLTALPLSSDRKGKEAARQEILVEKTRSSSPTALIEPKRKTIAEVSMEINGSTKAQ